MSEGEKVMQGANQKALVDAAWREMDQERALAGLLAEMRRIHYDAYIKKGFTPEQALVLCQKRDLG